MNHFGRALSIQIFGESHGSMLGVLIDGCPPGIALQEADFLTDLKRRQAGAKGTTPRVEQDLPLLKSGIFNGFTTGAPLGIFFENQNIKSADYSKIRDVYRPGHADFVADKKFGGYNDYRGGGHFSGRLTLALTAAGVVAKKIYPQLKITAQLIEAGGSPNIEEAIEMAIATQDSIGGIVECRACHVPLGLGEPFFDSVESMLAHIVFAIPAIKGIEFGSGFAAARLRGSTHNDAFTNAEGHTATNHAGGINGGISNGNELVFRVAVKPTSSTPQTQQTYNTKTGQVESFAIGGRHDLCIALRVPPVLEAVTAIVLADLMLQTKGKASFLKERE
ncbi:MAG: chorismate synthase [Cytophagales bacterium]|nr:MAG: chorismate synthase [Cytophagales bacterium]TAF61234.1 MAG: chorismate synthase [Cytophagales bacterium]